MRFENARTIARLIVMAAAFAPQTQALAEDLEAELLAPSPMEAAAAASEAQAPAPAAEGKVLEAKAASSASAPKAEKPAAKPAAKSAAAEPGADAVAAPAPAVSAASAAAPAATPAAQPPAEQAAAEQAPAAAFVQFNYAPADIPERAFSMSVPGDWDVKADAGGFNVFMEPKHKLKPTAENPTVADPKITVEVLRRTVHMDEKGLNDYEAEIKKQFAERPGLGTDLNVYQKILFPVSDSRKAFVFDLTYLWNGHEIFSTVVVMANENYMYRATLTDYKVNYSLNRDRLYPVMASIDFAGKALPRPAWHEKHLPWIYGIGGTLAVFVAFQFLYIRRARRNIGGDDMDDLENLVELDGGSGFRDEDPGDEARSRTATPRSEAGWAPSRAASAAPRPPKSKLPSVREAAQSSQVGSKAAMSKVPTKRPMSTPAKSVAEGSSFDFPQSEFGGAERSRALDNEFGNDQEFQDEFPQSQAVGFEDPAPDSGFPKKKKKK